MLFTERLMYKFLTPYMCFRCSFYCVNKDTCNVSNLKKCTCSHSVANDLMVGYVYTLKVKFAIRICYQLILKKNAT